jgi:exodeoxyribonuclease VII small subunit
MSDQPEAISELSFEAALKRLEEIVRKLESGEASLDESIELYGEGDRLRSNARRGCRPPRRGSRRSSSAATASRPAPSPSTPSERPDGRSPASSPRSIDQGAEIDAASIPARRPADPRARLYEAMRYAAIGGGKRLRPLLVVAACACSTSIANARFGSALAVECIHVYSLIHDDLPCMDDDDLRRGKPTLHKAYDESDRDPRRRFAPRPGLRDARRRGDPRGSVRPRRAGRRARPRRRPGGNGGRPDDGPRRRRADLDLAAVTRLQQLKTGALIGFCLEAGAIMGRVPPEGPDRPARLCPRRRPRLPDRRRPARRGRRGGQDRQEGRQGPRPRARRPSSRCSAASAPAAGRAAGRPGDRALQATAPKPTSPRHRPLRRGAGSLRPTRARRRRSAGPFTRADRRAAPRSPDPRRAESGRCHGIDPTRGAPSHPPSTIPAGANVP